MDSYTFAIKFTTQYVDVRINNDFEFYATLQQLAIFALVVVLLRGRKLVKEAVAGRRATKRAAALDEIKVDDWDLA